MTEADSFCFEEFEESLHTAVHRLELVKEVLLPKLCELADWLEMKDASLILNKWIFAEKATDGAVIPQAMNSKPVLLTALQQGDRCSAELASQILDQWFVCAQNAVETLESHTEAQKGIPVEVEMHPQGTTETQTIQIVMKTAGKERYSHTFSMERFNTLRSAYEVCTTAKEEGEEGSVPEQMSTNQQSHFLTRLLSMALRYEVLLVHAASEAMQGALLPAAFRALENDFGVSAELYASPINCTLPAFCSLFPATDLHFGSLGNVFSFGPLQGSFEVNPPFVKSCVRQFGEHCTKLLLRSEGASMALCFIVFVPKELYSTLIEEKGAEQFIVAKRTLRRGNHQYMWKSALWTATIDTQIVWLQTREAARVWPTTTVKVQRVVDAMSVVGFSPSNNQSGAAGARLLKGAIESASTATKASIATKTSIATEASIVTEAQKHESELRAQLLSAARDNKRPGAQSEADAKPCKRPRSADRAPRSADRAARDAVRVDADRAVREQADKAVREQADKAVREQADRALREHLWGAGAGDDNAQSGVPPAKTTKLEPVRVTATARIPDLQKPTRGDSNDGWVLLFRQTTPKANRKAGGFFKRNDWYVNADDESAACYSILRKLKGFRGGRRKDFELKLVWPETGLESQVWRQYSNPCESTRVEGYQAISCPHRDFSWGGLILDNKRCLLHGSSNDKNGRKWFYSLGAFREWHNPRGGSKRPGDGGMPGPCGGQGLVVHNVELWVKDPAWRNS